MTFQMCTSKKANMEKESLEVEMADTAKPGNKAKLEGSIKRYASQLSLEPDYTVCFSYLSFIFVSPGFCRHSKTRDRRGNASIDP